MSRINPTILLTRVYILRRVYKMIEFLCGWIIGVWMGQQLPLPSVQEAIHNWWNKNQQVVDQEEEETQEEEARLFTGEMPVQVPSV